VGRRKGQRYSSEFQRRAVERMFATNLGRAPEGIRQAHFANQVDHILRHGRTSLSMAALPTPVQPEPSMVPSDHCLGFHNHEGRAPATPQPRQPNPEQTVSHIQTEPSPPILSLKDRKLMPKGEDLGVKRVPTSETLPERREQGENDREHRFANYSPSALNAIGSISTQFLVGTGRKPRL